MGKRIKCYLVFTSLFYRIVMFLLVPAALTGSYLWLRSVVGGAGAMGDMWLMTAMTSALSLVEIYSDNWLFGGIHTRDTVKTDYLRTSGRGMGIMRKALAMDMLRKFLSAAGISAICCLAVLCGGGGMAGGLSQGDFAAWVGAAEGGGIWRVGVMLFPAAVSWFLSVLGTYLARFADMLWVSMLVGYGAFLLGLLSLGLPGLWKYIWGYDILFLFLGLSVSVLAVRTAMKKVEGSYHD